MPGEMNIRPSIRMCSWQFHQKWQINSNIGGKQPFIVSDEDNRIFRYMYKEKIKKTIFFRIIHRNENVNGEVFTLILSFGKMNFRRSDERYGMGPYQLSKTETWEE